MTKRDIIMKNKHKKRFTDNYKWWDSYYLLLAMEGLVGKRKQTNLKTRMSSW